MILGARSGTLAISPDDRKVEQKRMLISYSLQQRLDFLPCSQLAPSGLIFRDLWRLETRVRLFLGRSASGTVQRSRLIS